MKKFPFALALHGGAGAVRRKDYGREIAHMRGLVEAARDALAKGAKALDVAVETVAALEASGLYVAGRGASPNLAGRYELDASLMNGADGRAGAVAALQGFASPIAVARAVMEKTPHVMLVGEGATTFARAQGFAEIDKPDGFFTQAGKGEHNHPPGVLAHGTVGCVVRDVDGNLAAATSTAGVFQKLPGRVGDTPLIGAGTFADRNVAVSCTGQGEYFIRVAAAAQIAFRCQFLGQTLTEATQAVLDAVGKLGGDGGLIAIDAAGELAAPFLGEGMKRALLTRDGEILSDAF